MRQDTFVCLTLSQADIPRSTLPHFRSCVLPTTFFTSIAEPGSIVFPDKSFKMKYSIAFLTALAVVNASPLPYPQAVTDQISPDAPAPSGCTDGYSGTFGVAVMNVTAAASGAAVPSAAPDGQPQAPTGGAPVSTIADGQPQAAPTGAAPAPVSTIADGQPQAPTGAPAPVTTIADGQPQAPTGASVAPVTTIADGQPQAPVSQISDGQVQAPTMSAVTQIGDGK